MASLDAARALAQQEGIWEEPLRAGTAISAALQELPGLEVLSHKHVGMFMPSSLNNATANASCCCTLVLNNLCCGCYSCCWCLSAPLLLLPRDGL